MIDIKNKKDCVGCNACVQRCPKKCIDMYEDGQGFLYPKVNLEQCINCGLCEMVCPVINQMEFQKPLSTYAAKNKDKDIQETSSSGGIFFALAKWIIENGGIVFGAKFNKNWDVIHDYTETIEGIKAFQTSKYVQSKIGNTFSQVEKILKNGRKVLFSGTPCQIAGLRLFLRKEYDNLISVDVVCHGVPSPLIWREYLKYITQPEGVGVGRNSDYQSTQNDKNRHVITGINFRDKRLSWEKFGLSVQANACKGDKNTDFQSCYVDNSESFELLFELHNKNIYMQAFLKDLDLRPSCYACPAKCGKSKSDITLADFWGIKRYFPENFDKKGVSLLLVNSSKIIELFNKLSIRFFPVKYDIALSVNPAIEKSARLPKQSKQMWINFYNKGIPGIAEITTTMQPSLIKRIFAKIIYALLRL